MSRWKAFWSWARFPVLAFAVSRVSVVLVTELSMYLDPRLHRPGGPTPFLGGLCRWDCGWYAGILKDGYASPAHANFFPLFPLLGRAVAWVTRLSPELSLVLVANAAALAAAVLMYRLFEELSDASTARTAVALQIFWPFSFFSATGYTEPLLICGTVASLWFARHQRFVPSGVALGLAALARHLSILAWPAVAYEFVRGAGTDWKRALLRPRVLLLALPAAIFGLYPLFLWQRLDSPLYFLTGRSGDWAAHGIWEFFQHPWWPQIAVYVGFAPVTLIGAGLLLKRREWWPMAAFAIPFALVSLALGLTGLGRYLASCWPAFLPLGAWLQKRPELEGPVLGACGMLQALLLYLFSHSYAIT